MAKKNGASSEPCLTTCQNEGKTASYSRQNSKTHVSSEMPGSPHSKTLNIQKESFNMEIKVSSVENVRVEVEIEERSDDEPTEGACIREESRNRLKRLGKLYAGGENAEISSPIHKTEAKFAISDNVDEDNRVNRNKPHRGLGKLADLAQNINQWEDEVTPRKEHKQASPKKTWKPKAPQPPSSPEKVTPVGSPSKSTQKSNEMCKDIPKSLKWDKSVLESLESKSAMQENIAEEEINENEPSSPSKVKIRGAVVANRAAMFESSPSKHTNKDPALMSVAERKALFEKNKGAVLTPKAPFAMPVPLKTEVPKRNTSESPKKKPTVQKFEESKKYQAPKPPVTAKPCVEVPTKGIASKVAALLENKSTISQEQIESNIKEQRQKEMQVLLNRFNKNKVLAKENVPPEIIESASESEEDNEATEMTAMISSKPVKIVSKGPSSHSLPPPPPPLPVPGSSEKKRLSKGDSPKVTSVLENVKRIKVSPQKPGRLYPCLSDIEAATETETEQNNTPTPPESSSEESFLESEDGNTSFGRDVLEVVRKNHTPQKRPIYDDSTASDISDVLDDMDDYLDEAMAHNNSNGAGPTPPKQGRLGVSPEKSTKPSNSFSYKSFSPAKTVVSPKKSNDLPAYVVDGDSVLPLTHTVSFYRKQQNQVSASTTPIKQIIRQPLIEEEEDEHPENKDVEKKIKELTEEVNKQQLVISQTSQALNLCNSTPEFMGSTEQVEAEKVLLVATHRRMSLLQEIQRLKVEKSLRPMGQHAQKVPLEKGSITISNVTLPLKKEYVRALAAAGGKGHHVVCLVKCDEQVVPTQLASTVVRNSRNPETELNIPGVATLKNIYSDFTVTFEVYCLQAQEEVIPHEVKYHINNKKPSAKLTPKKGKHESKLSRPPKESPAGPQAVRSSTFALMGYVVFSIQAVNRTHWTLNNTPPMCPLEGSVQMKVNCELAVTVEHKGFLTMFEDVSGFGAWHRRWCLLKGSNLSYWKYPDDEKSSPPIDTIDLKNCITKEVGLVSRDICARPHTFLVAREREAQPNDKDSLTTVCTGSKTIIRHLLSADTKEERIEWCNKFNAALMALRMWGK